MRLQQFQNNYLYEGLDRSATQSMMLWESAGFKLKEAALTADQIQQIFQSVEQGATDAGGNRTLLGKGKDAASAVNKAWEDLKTKIQDSGPIKNVDNAYDSAVAKIEAGLGGPDNAINKVIQKYRKFAKEHPIAQGLIYSALIAAAGISGAGLGGAAVLGLLKMADKLLQGEKFSSAAYSGAKTGAMAYGASKIGDMIKGKPEGGVGGGEMSPDMQQGLAADQAFQDRILNKFPPDKGYTFTSSGDSLQVLDANGVKVFTGDVPLKTMDMKTFADLTNNGQMATPGISSGSISSDAMAGVSDKAANAAGSSVASSSGNVSNVTTSTSGGVQTTTGTLSGITSDQIVAHPAFKATYADQIAKFGGDTAQARQVAQKVAAAAARKAMLKGESQSRKGKKLSEGQVYLVFNRVCAKQLNEGPLDAIKGLAGKAADKAKTVGKNLTTKVTADKLNSAWKKAGSPLDSEEVAKVITAAGVGDDIVKSVYTDLKIPAAGSAADPAAMPDTELDKLIDQLNTKQKKEIVKYLQQQLRAA
jgi:hypothetical protein